MTRILILSAATAALAVVSAGSASAITVQECSTKYQAAKQGGSLNGMKWNDFRKAECGATASATPTASSAAATAPPATTTAAAPQAATPAARPAPAAKSATSAPAAPASAAGYPASIDPKYASETPGKGRMHTCLDAYKAAKASGSLGDTKWIQKGGGYYSSCNSRLKGA